MVPFRKVVSRTVKALRGVKKTKTGSNTDSPFYKISPSCQIPSLWMLYENYFGQTTTGSFLECGAYDGEHYSNTSGLADAGWRGVYVEPVPEFYEKCVVRHKNNNVQVLCCALGSGNGEMTLHLSGAITTGSKEVQEHFREMGWGRDSSDDTRFVMARIQTLDDVLSSCQMPEGFEVLSIDVEGLEEEVLKGFAIGIWKPQMVIIELHDQNRNYLKFRDQAIRIYDSFLKAGYKVTFKDFTNTVFVRKDVRMI